ncbi:UDP-N-acetylglucosamine 1-carboxyvinyltransferase [Candidatus Dojkabacteria bacterium]|nr:UDP-N-acetylglucosamine 1-carboxyvinyltransferase [Candidatus Dojkabacteria bacterium]
MADLIVSGGNKLSGKITPAGNKNAALPIICASLLTDEDVILHNVPDIIDMHKIVESMRALGSKIEWDIQKGDMTINNRAVGSNGADALPMGLRGSVLLLAPMVQRLKNVKLPSTIGGCSLGIRELDPHFEVMKALGADVNVEWGEFDIKIDGRFPGGSYWFDYMAVTATETFLMAASLAKNESMLMNAASEPHVQELCVFLTQMGAKISGIGSSKLVVEGVEKLSGTEYTIGSDHHEITTFLALGAMTGGEVWVTDAVPKHFMLIQRAFKKLGIDIDYEGNTAHVAPNQKLVIEQGYTENMLTKIEAAPWPYFPADLLHLMMALATKAKGQMMFWNKVYEGSFMWLPELQKLGAQVVLCDPHRAIIWGGKKLHPAVINAPDIIRATVALYMVAATIEGETVIKNADVIKRAHPNFVEKLNSLGGKVEWEES